tara:strand:+ start:455 stop:667 length:213 start_codon:yes stop_codon:yes gene_type:complete
MKKYKYPQQLPINFKPRESTPQEFDDWQKNELEPLAEVQMKFIAFMAVVQFVALATMFTAFYLIGLGLNG